MLSGAKFLIFSMGETKEGAPRAKPSGRQKGYTSSVKSKKFFLAELHVKCYNRLND